MGYGVSIPVLLIGCAVLAHCQRPPADDEDFAFSHEGSGRAVLAPPSGRSDPVPLPPSSGGIYGSVVHRQPSSSSSDYGTVSRHDSADPALGGVGGDYGSGYGDDDEYYDDEYDYDAEYDYGDEYYDEKEDPSSAPGGGLVTGGAAGHDDHRQTSDPYGPEVVVPDRQPPPSLPDHELDRDRHQEEHIGVVHAAPPPPPEQTDRPDRYGQPGEQPPVYGTELRPTEPPRPDPVPDSVDEATDRDNGLDFPPELDLPGVRGGAGTENDIEDGTVGGEPAADPDHLPDGMGSKAIDRPTSFFAQPGILAAVVGGAVVGLLCAILLVMLIVYRMRKKDEGSYALDEPKRSLTGNSYSKNYNKEFYA